MVAYHTPKIYRITAGCCICKGKSSSSRFTDSTKYECDFAGCFRLQEPRCGVICNACVLIVKRWKKLPQETTRHWNYVVDSRERPRRRPHSSQRGGSQEDPCWSPEFSDAAPKRISKKHRYIPKGLRDRSPSVDLALSEEGSSLPSMPSSRAPSPAYNMADFDLSAGSVALPSISRGTSSRRKQKTPVKFRCRDEGGFIDHNYWTKEDVCCGTLFRGECGEVLIDCSTFNRSCPLHAVAPLDNSILPTLSLDSAERPSSTESCSREGQSDSGSSIYDDEESFYGMPSYCGPHGGEGIAAQLTASAIVT